MIYRANPESMVVKPSSPVQYAPYEDVPVATNGTVQLDPKLVLVALTILGVIGIIALVMVSRNKKGGK